MSKRVSAARVRVATKHICVPVVYVCAYVNLNICLCGMYICHVYACVVYMFIVHIIDVGVNPKP